jgi:integrase
MPLTANKINALEPPVKRRMVCDGRGLWLEVHPSGRKTWRFRYTLRKRASTVNLGHHPWMSLADARKRRDELAAAIRDGLSPAEQKQREKLAQERDTTLQAFAERYLQEVVARYRRDVGPMRRYFERDVFPALGGKLLTRIEPDELRDLIFTRRESGKPRAALAIRALLKRMWDYAIVCNVTERNPLAAIPAKYVAAVKSRSRALKPVEIAAFLTALDAARIRDDLKAALRLVLLTMVRKGELRLARWDEFDLERGEWHIPEAHSKTLAQIVYLPRQAVEILTALKNRRLPGQNCVFPARNALDTPMSANTLNVALACVPVKIEHFTVHDLRRTAATNLSEMEFMPDVIEKALNHKIKGVRGVYNRAQYATQRREMLQTWADFLDGLL